jgi:hypothetical protein
MDFGYAVFESSALNLIFDLAIPQSAFKGDELPRLDPTTRGSLVLWNANLLTYCGCLPDSSVFVVAPTRTKVCGRSQLCCPCTVVSFNPFSNWNVRQGTVVLALVKDGLSVKID